MGFSGFFLSLFCMLHLIGMGCGMGICIIQLEGLGFGKAIYIDFNV